MGYGIVSGHLCRQGLVRRENQDSFFEYVGERISVFCVADGMGGHTGGMRASKEITDGIRKWVNDFYPGKYESDFWTILNDFEACLSEINRYLYKFYNRGSVCGSTLAVLLLYGGYYAIFSLGDSRIYRKRGLSFRQLTKDDVWQNSDQVPRGLSAEEIKCHGNYDKLVGALGIRESFLPQRKTDKLRRGDTFLLCSDGVYKYCAEDVLRKACGRNIPGRDVPVREGIRLLAEEVMKNGAPDNFTAVLVSAKSKISPS